MRFRLHSLTLVALALFIAPGWGQVGSNLEVLPDTPEKVVDLWGNELRLYFDLPDNILVFIDTQRNVRSKVAFGLNERNDMMMAYMSAANITMAMKNDEQKDSGVSVTLRERKVAFKVARRDGRSWVVLYVDNGEGEQARFAIPQTWELKDPKLKELIDIKRGFERLMLKAAL